MRPGDVGSTIQPVSARSANAAMAGGECLRMMRAPGFEAAWLEWWRGLSTPPPEPRDRSGCRRPAQFDDLEIAGVKAVECRIQNTVVPARIHGALHVHISATIRHDQPVSFHRLEDATNFRWIARNVHRRFESETHSERRRTCIRGSRV